MGESIRANNIFKLMLLLCVCVCVIYNCNRAPINFPKLSIILVINKIHVALKHTCKHDKINSKSRVIHGIYKIV